MLVNRTFKGLHWYEGIGVSFVKKATNPTIPLIVVHFLVSLHVKVRETSNFLISVDFFYKIRVAQSEIPYPKIDNFDFIKQEFHISRIVCRPIWTRKPTYIRVYYRSDSYNLIVRTCI